MRILLVEDMVEFGQHLHELLTDEGHSVVFLVSSSNAMRMIENQRFDLLISDFDLGFREPTGLELIDHTHVMSPDTVTILFSGIDRTWEAKEERVFPDHILIKNDIDGLLEAISEVQPLD